MKPSAARRYRRRSAHAREPGQPLQEQARDQAFFAPPGRDSFFPPTGIHRAEEAPAEKKEETVSRAPVDEEKKREEQKVAKASEEKKEEGTVSAAPEEKKEEGKVSAATEEKKEEGKVSAAAEEKKEEKVAKKGDDGGAGEATVQYVRSLGGRGEPLGASEKEFFGQRMGYDFSSVRIHTGEEAAVSARDAGAKAYTYGNHIVFNAGRFEPGTHEGRRLLAHELTHVVQQGSSPAGRGTDPMQGGVGTVGAGGARDGGRGGARDAANAGAKGRAWGGAKGGEGGQGGKAGRQVQRGWIGDAWNAATTAAGALWSGVQPILGWAWDVVKSAGAWIWDLITWSPWRVWSLLSHYGSAIVGIATHLWNGLMTNVDLAASGLLNWFSWIKDGAYGLFGWIWRGLQGGRAWAIRLLHGEQGAFWDGVADAFAWLGDGGRAFLQWEWNGLMGLAAWAGGGIRALARWCWEGLVGGLAWMGRLVFKIFDLFGGGELWTLFWNILKGYTTRTLNDLEIKEAGKVYGDTIAYWQVRIDEGSAIAKFGAWLYSYDISATTIGHTIGFNRKPACAAGNRDMALLIHELGHVSQYTFVGMRYLGEAMHAQATEGYGYGGGAGLAGKNLADFNREQQCAILEDYYKHVLYGSSPYAADYQRMRDQALAGKY